MGYFHVRLWDLELSDWAVGGNLPSSSKKQRVFPLQTYPWVSFNLIGFNKRNQSFCQIDNFTYFSQTNLQGNFVIISVMSTYQPFRLSNLNKGCVCVTRIGDSLGMRLLPGLELWNQGWQRFFFRLFSKVNNVVKMAYLCRNSWETCWFMFYFINVVPSLVNYAAYFSWVVWLDAIWGQLCEITPLHNIRRPEQQSFIYTFQFKAIGVLVGSCLHQKQKNAHYNVVHYIKCPSAQITFVAIDPIGKQIPGNQKCCQKP